MPTPSLRLFRDPMEVAETSASHNRHSALVRRELNLGKRPATLPAGLEIQRNRLPDHGRSLLESVALTDAARKLGNVGGETTLVLRLEDYIVLVSCIHI